MFNNSFRFVAASTSRSRLFSSFLLGKKNDNTLLTPHDLEPAWWNIPAQPPGFILEGVNTGNKLPQKAL